MGEFLTDLQCQPFLRYALLTGVLASVACGVVGTYVVARRISYIAGGISHSVLAGMGAARYLETVHHWTWLHPLHGAVAAALAAALVIGVVSMRAREREDTVIGAVWAVGMAIGVLFIFKTPGYNQDLMGYLFGNVLMVSPDDLRIIAGLDILVVSVGLLFYNRFLAVCFDDEFARLRGIHVGRYYLALLCLTALTVVLLVTVVGIIMVIALLTIPAAVAGRFSRNLFQMMLLSTGFTILFTTAGLALSYGPDLPAGATTIVLAGGVYIGVLTVSFFVRRRQRPGQGET
ncbi:MAG: metal ABC transporter permease [Deltaproteobacteria bacterium]|nr:MAG: metal ABC transporter permease [Deltaproteobacteria bacterium]